MNGIMGMISLTKEKLEPDSPVLQYIDKADELSEHLLALINDILDMSRIEAGKVELEEQPFSIKTLGTRLYDMFAKNLEERGIAYAVNYENMSVDMIIGDQLRISQVIINFLSNAVKFTHEGEVSVTFRQMMLLDGIIDLMISVHDTGIGMSPEFINRIFRPFEQESISTSRDYGGTGLGMAITDNLVKIMGGEIVVQSEPGKGSDFFVYLHLPVYEEAGSADSTSSGTDETTTMGTAERKHSFKGRRILVAEDNEINAMIAAEILGNMGAEEDKSALLDQNAQKGTADTSYLFSSAQIDIPVDDTNQAVIMENINEDAMGLYRGQTISEQDILCALSIIIAGDNSDKFYSWSIKDLNKYIRFTGVSFDGGQTWENEFPVEIPKDTNITDMLIKTEYRYTSTGEWESMDVEYALKNSRLYVLSNSLNESDEQIDMANVLNVSDYNYSSEKTISLYRYQSGLLGTEGTRLNALFPGWMERGELVDWNYTVTSGRHILEPAELVELPEGYSVQSKIWRGIFAGRRYW